MNRSQSGWPQTQTQVPNLPANLQPAGIQGLPQGKQPLNEAEELLSTAVGWWDAKYYTEGDRWLRNRGTGGSALDARLGSSTTPNSNDPLYLKPEDSGYVYQPGSTGNYLGIADSSEFNITGNIDVRIKVAYDSTTGTGALVGRNYATGMGSFRFYRTFFDVNGQLGLDWYDNTDTVNTALSTASPNVVASTPLWLRVTLNLNNGSGQWEVKFWQSLDSSSWAQVGNTVVGATTSTLRPGTGLIEVGTLKFGTISHTSGKFYNIQVFNGIDGTKVLDINCDTDILSAEATSFTATSGQTVTINRATSGRKTVVMPSKTKGGSPIFLFGTDDYMEVVGSQQHALLNFDAGQSFTVLAAVRQHATVQDSRTYVGKFQHTASTGYRLGNQGTTMTVALYGNAGLQSTTGDAMSTSAMSVVGGYRQKIGGVQQLGTFLNGTRSATVTKRESSPALVARWPFQVGYSPGLYADFEFAAAAVFRRALTDREIKLINDYYQNRVKPPTYVDPEPAVQKTFIANQLGVNEATYSDALDILKDADFYVDSRSFDGSNYWKNLGKRGAALNMRLGSTQASDSNDPKYLSPETSGYVYLPAVASNYMSVTSSSALQITGDLDLRVQVQPLSWRPSSLVSLNSKWTTGARSWQFYLDASGLLYLLLSNDATTSYSIASSTGITDFGANATRWVKATYRASDRRVQFFWSVDGSSWTQVGTDVTMPTVTSIAATTTEVAVGAYNLGSGVGDAKYYKAQVYSGIDGTKVLDIDCDQIVDGRQTSFQALTGQTVTINRSTSGRKSVAMPNTTVKTMDPANVYLPGVSGNYLSVPDPGATTQPPVDLVFDGPFLWLEKDGVTLPNEQQNVSLDIVGDIDIQCKVALDDWTPGGNRVFVGKFADTAATGSYVFFVTGTGYLSYSWSNGSTITNKSSTAIPAVTDGTPMWVRVTHDVNNGASGNDIKFFTSYDGDTWTQLGSTVTTAGTTSLNNSSAELRLGNDSESGSPFVAAGRFYRAIVKDGLAGTTVLDANCSVITSSSQSSFTATTGQTVTINSTVNSGLRVNPLKTGAGIPVFLLGTDDYLECEGGVQHEVLNFKPGDDYSALVVMRKWSQTATYGPNKKYDTGAGAGWTIYSINNATWLSLQNADGYVSAKAGGSFLKYGKMQAFTGSKTGSTLLGVYDTTTETASDTTSSAGSYANQIPLRIGRNDSGTYSDFELVAVAVWRNKALTSAQAQTLTTFFGA